MPSTRRAAPGVLGDERLPAQCRLILVLDPRRSCRARAWPPAARSVCLACFQLAVRRLRVVPGTLAAYQRCRDATCSCPAAAASRVRRFDGRRSRPAAPTAAYVCRLAARADRDGLPRRPAAPRDMPRPACLRALGRHAVPELHEPGHVFTALATGARAVCPAFVPTAFDTASFAGVERQRSP